MELDVRGSLLELFWMPNESIRWLRTAAQEFDLWIVMWRVHNPALEIGAGELSADMLCDVNEEIIHFFLGRHDLGPPKWRESNGRRLLDFPRSYATQFVPAVLSQGRTMLLEGRMTMLGRDGYDDPVRAEHLASLFGSLRSSLRKHSDRERVVVQDLVDGTVKKLPGVLVGPEVPGDGSIELKQIAGGAVSFRIESRTG